jgi:putative transposase
VGSGHLYQGRFKSFVVQSDAHFLAVSRYVEANALNGKLVRRAEDWRWGSLWRVQRAKIDVPPRIHPWPVPRPSDWLTYVNQPAEAAETDALRRCARRGCPYGDEAWAAEVAEHLGLQSTLRARGRPAREEEEESDPFSGKRVLTPFSPFSRR